MHLLACFGRRRLFNSLWIAATRIFAILSAIALFQSADEVSAPVLVANLQCKICSSQLHHASCLVFMSNVRTARPALNARCRAVAQQGQLHLSMLSLAWLGRCFGQRLPAFNGRSFFGNRHIDSPASSQRFQQWPCPRILVEHLSGPFSILDVLDTTSACVLFRFRVEWLIRSVKAALDARFCAVAQQGQLHLSMLSLACLGPCFGPRVPAGYVHRSTSGILYIAASCSSAIVSQTAPSLKALMPLTAHVQLCDQS